MPGELAKVDDWYTQTAKEFRQDVRKTVSVYWANSRIAKAIKTRTGQGVLIVGLISLLGVWIKGKPQTPFYETIFDNLDSIALGSAGVIFLFEIQDRKKRSQYEAWQVINLAQGKGGSGGRIEALQDLHRDGANLEGVSAPGADLSGIDLRGANLRGANLISAKLDGAKLDGADLSFALLTLAKMRDCELRGANLREANLAKTKLQRSKLQGAKMVAAKMKEADLSNAELQGAHLQQADLEDALLPCANLQKTNLAGTCLKNAILQKAKLQNAYMLRTSLKEAYLEGAELEGTCIFMTDLKEAKGLTHNQLAQSMLYQVILPAGITIKPSLDCTDLGVDPQGGLFSEDFEEYSD